MEKTLKFKPLPDSKAPSKKDPVKVESKIDFSTLSDDSRLRLKQFVPAWIPISSATAWRGVADGTFPKPAKLSSNCTAWRVGDLRAWLASRPSA
jgi:prophage regulatory protein